MLYSVESSYCELKKKTNKKLKQSSVHPKIASAFLMTQQTTKEEGRLFKTHNLPTCRKKIEVVYRFLIFRGGVNSNEKLRKCFQDNFSILIDLVDMMSDSFS